MAVGDKPLVQRIDRHATEPRSDRHGNPQQPAAQSGFLRRQHADEVLLHARHAGHFTDRKEDRAGEHEPGYIARGRPQPDTAEQHDGDAEGGPDDERSVVVKEVAEENLDHLTDAQFLAYNERNNIEEGQH